MDSVEETLVKEVLKDLPDKIETIRYAQMGDEQRKVYEAQLLKTRYLIEKEKNKIEILSALTRLRQICVNPNMFLDSYSGDSAKINLLLELLDGKQPIKDNIIKSKFIINKTTK